jgi:hypothetical protein
MHIMTICSYLLKNGSLKVCGIGSSDITEPQSRKLWVLVFTPSHDILP